LQPGVDFGLKVASPIGNLVGQILFGWLADLVGRKRMCKCEWSICFIETEVVLRTMADGIELMIIITATFTQALAGSGPAVNIVGVLTCLRFIMGIGIGGDYPLSAVISSEFAATRSRGRLMTAVFASQGWGYLGKNASHTQ
jgi:PHS family inorganic phosphate transporter-like MFS transporter